MYESLVCRHLAAAVIPGLNFTTDIDLFLCDRKLVDILESKMTKDAIYNVVNQLVGMNKMKIARADYLAPYANSPEEYTKKAQLFNKYADYRLFQELTPAEVKKIKLAMTPAEREEISKKIKEAQMAGIIK